LRIFEQLGLPIPDIIAFRQSEMLIIEIDKAFAKAARSLESYRANMNRIVTELRLGVQLDVDQLSIGFCRTGLVKCPEQLLALSRLHVGLDLWVGFTGPGSLVCYWTGRAVFEK